MGRSQTIDALLLSLLVSGFSGMWMVISGGFAAPFLWMPIGSIALGFMALQQLIDDEFRL